MDPIEVNQISKTFGFSQALADVSFAVKRGEIFGLLGPNGAGKTTAIRIILNILNPDNGSVTVLGGAMTEEKKSKIGYLPEERGLYQDMPLDRCLLYLATLKNIPVQEARLRLDEYLARFDLMDCKKKKVKELSKGMQQKAQLISTILHKPDLIIVDEPFSGLDPINVHLAIEVLNELRQQGATIILSTHQMHQVEELCDRILLIHHGKTVLYGGLAEIRMRFSGHEVLVRTDGDLDILGGMNKIQTDSHSWKLTLAENVTSQEILQSLVNRGYFIEKFEIAIPSMDEIFIRAVAQEIP
jgi:ABC-2 type transport system ATP-binding protein